MIRVRNGNFHSSYIFSTLVASLMIRCVRPDGKTCPCEDNAGLIYSPIPGTVKYTMSLQGVLFISVCLTASPPPHSTHSAIKIFCSARPEIVHSGLFAFLITHTHTLLCQLSNWKIRAFYLAP